MRLRLSVAAASLCCGTAGAADALPKAEPPAVLPPIFAPRPAAPPPGERAAPVTAVPRTRAISPEMSAKLKEATARLVPAPVFGGKASAAPATNPAPSGDPAAGDALQMQPYVVRGDKLPSLNQDQLQSLVKNIERHAMGEEEAASARRREMKELSGLYRIGGDKAPPGLQKKIDESMSPPKGWIDERGTPFRPPR
ncbi:MAG TPA: hypothetical protein VM029_20215 [Opitutaceae bacterium]|nr:hypothetical protein [Opitutaceae bacterium]